MEKAMVDKLLRRCLGYYFIHLGQWPAIDRYQATPIKRQIVIAEQIQDTTLPRITAHMDALPIQSDTVDAVYCPHVLEFIDKPHDVLRELERLLVPEGFLIISCFNPWNLWNAVRRLPFRATKLPRGNLLSCSRLKDWLQLLGFDIVCVETVAPAMSQDVEQGSWWARWLKIGYWKKWFSSSGSFIIMAQKQQIALTPVKYKWSLRSKIITAGLVEPSTRS